MFFYLDLNFLVLKYISGKLKDPSVFNSLKQEFVCKSYTPSHLIIRKRMDYSEVKYSKMALIICPMTIIIHSITICQMIN